MNQFQSRTAPLSGWLRIVILLGLAWNLFGLVQLLGTLQQSAQSGMMHGMSAEAARVYFNLPVWMNLAFALGAGGGAIGCVAMSTRRAAAVPILAISATGYSVLFLGDWELGLFSLLPNQLTVLILVLAIALCLLALAVKSRRAGVLNR